MLELNTHSFPHNPVAIPEAGGPNPEFRIQPFPLKCQSGVWTYSTTSSGRAKRGGVRKNKVGEAGRPPLDYISRDAQQEGGPRPTRPLPTGTAGAVHPVEPSGALRLATSATAGNRGTFPRSGAGTSAVLEPHVVVKAGVSAGERDREEALGRGRDPRSLAERRSASPLPAPGACPASGYLTNAARLRVP